MTRVKRGFKARRRRKKLLSLAKGYRQTRKNCYRTAVHVLRKGLTYAYRDRKVKKREFRKLWIVRINAAARAEGMRYSELISGLKKANISMDRSVLADIALHDPQGFASIVKQAKAALAA
jgi:large subunit ribosomal protein L20